MDGAASSRTIGSLETWEPEDKSFSKHVLTEGTGDTKPNEGSVCNVFITLIGEIELSAENLAEYKIGEECEVTIGEGDTLLSELIDKVVCSMKEGEKCYIKSKVDEEGRKVGEMDVGKKAVKLNVILSSFSRAADSCDLEQDERLDRALHHKENGTQLYQKNNVTFAVKRFKKAVKYLLDMEPVEKLPGDLMDRYRTLKCQCYLNLGACYLKKEKYETVIEVCSKALMLDSGNVKGLFRRGQAYAKLHEFELARTDLLQAKQLDPSNKAVLTQLRDLDVNIRNEKKMYQKMFPS